MAEATADFYIAHTPTDGVPYWDTGAPGLAHLGDYLGRARRPLQRPRAGGQLGRGHRGAGPAPPRQLPGRARRGRDRGARYRQAGLTVARTLFAEPYLSTDPAHEGLLLHSVYHRPNGWDHVPPGRKVPCGESAMWGDYHARELALLILREAEGGPYLKFFLD